MTSHPSLKISLRAAIAFIVIRLVVFYAGISFEQIDMIMVFLGLFGLIPLAIYALWPRNKVTTLLEDISGALRIMGLYVVIITFYTYIHYSFVDTAYFSATQADIIEAAVQSESEDKRAEITENVQAFFSVRNASVMLLLLSIALSIFYALLFSAIKRLAFRKV